MSFHLKSPAFEHDQPIPKAHAQEGANSSPPLVWDDVPEGTKSLVLVVEDHDAPIGTVTHWVVFDIDPGLRELPEGLGADQARQGLNDMGHANYDGPKPPKGHGPHRYHFRLAALDVASLDFSGEPASNDVKKAARGHVLAEIELIGTYETRW